MLKLENHIIIIILQSLISLAYVQYPNIKKKDYSHIPKQALIDTPLMHFQGHSAYYVSFIFL